MMSVHWKALIALGVTFWVAFYFADLLGESSWKRYSPHLEDILDGHMAQVNRIKKEAAKIQQERSLNWPLLLWNVGAIIFSMVFFSAVKSLSWLVWKVFVLSSAGFKNRNLLMNFFKNAGSPSKTNKTTSAGSDDSINLDDTNPNAKILFKSRSFCQNRPLQDNVMMAQEHATLWKQLEDTKRENCDLSRDITSIKKENLDMRRQVEEFKLETTLLQDKLTKTVNALNEHQKFKDFASANQELMIRKNNNLGVVLQEVSRDRDLLRNKVMALERSQSKLEQRLREFESQKVDNVTEIPEKDEAAVVTVNTEVASDGEAPLSQFHRKLNELRCYSKRPCYFDSNSKLSLDIDESGADTSRDSEPSPSSPRKPDLGTVKQNLINYDAYKKQIFRPKCKPDHIEEEKFIAADVNAGSSSDETAAPRRIISSTMEFQNILKTLKSSSTSSFNRK